MKTISLVSVCLLLISLLSCQPGLVKDSTIEATPAVSTFQQHVLAEINLARTNPALYAESRLKAASMNATDNGSYLYMKNLSSLSALSFNKSLNLAATNYALFLAKKDLMGHNKNGTPIKRAIDLGFSGSMIGENIAASSGDSYNATVDPQTAAIEFVRIMIIDAGVGDLVHRLTTLSSDYKTIGIGYSRNPASTFINYNVQDFGD